MGLSRVRKLAPRLWFVWPGARFISAARLRAPSPDRARRPEGAGRFAIQRGRRHTEVLGFGDAASGTVLVRPLGLEQRTGKLQSLRYVCPMKLVAIAPGLTPTPIAGARPLGSGRSRSAHEMLTNCPEAADAGPLGGRGLPQHPYSGALRGRHVLTGRARRCLGSRGRRFESGQPARPETAGER
jgi:hypothetical protein